MTHFILLVLACQERSPEFEAYELFYKKGLELLENGKHEDAITEFDAAIKKVGSETKELRYRRNAILNNHEYYPWYMSGLAAARHAKSAAAPEEKARRLEDAERRLRKSNDPRAKSELETVRKLLNDLSLRPKDLPPPPDFAPLEAGIDRLCKAERFEEALANLAERRDLFASHDAKRSELERQIRDRQTVAVKDREVRLDGVLNGIEGREPLLRPRDRAKALSEATLPAGMQSARPPKFKWLEDFLKTYETHLNDLESPPSEEPALSRMARVFEETGNRAAEADFPPGLSASRNLAQALRLARLNALVAAASSGSTSMAEASKRAREIETAFQEGAGRCEGIVRKQMEKTPDATVRSRLKAYLEGPLAAQRRDISEFLVRLDPDVESQVSGVEISVVNPRVAIDPSALRRLAGQMAALQSDSRFGVLPASRRASCYLSSALAEATAGLLTGTPREELIKSISPAVSRGCKLDPDALARLRELDLISPTVLALFEEARRRQP